VKAFGFAPCLLFLGQERNSSRRKASLSVFFVTAVRAAALMSPICVIGQRPVTDRKIEQRKTQSRIAHLVCGQAVQRILSAGFPHPGLGPTQSGLPITFQSAQIDGNPTPRFGWFCDDRTGAWS
jgi:hypothetical protein